MNNICHIRKIPLAPLQNWGTSGKMGLPHISNRSTSQKAIVRFCLRQKRFLRMFRPITFGWETDCVVAIGVMRSLQCVACYCSHTFFMPKGVLP